MGDDGAADFDERIAASKIIVSDVKRIVLLLLAFIDECGLRADFEEWARESHHVEVTHSAHPGPT